MKSRQSAAGTLKADTPIKPKRKKWVQIFALILFCAGVYGVTNSTLSLTFVTWGSAFLLFVWDHHTDKQDTQIRKKAYISKFPTDELRTDIYSPNKVYRVIERNDKSLTVELIWSGEKEVRNGEAHRIDLDSVRPFDMELFLNLT